VTAFQPWQTILSGLGWVLARLYDFIPNYGVAIILLTVMIRLLLLPLGVKQIRSMQATQALQPKIKALQTKYKGDRQKLNEEMMKLYKEHGYNPLSGCLPLLLQLPVLIALFAVLRYPTGLTHIPADSSLHAAIVNQDTYFLGANLTCSAVEAGKQVKVVVPEPNGKTTTTTKDCGTGFPVRIPYYVLAVLMVGTTYFQQRQMSRAAPAGASSQQQQLMRFMPLIFGFWGFIFPAGLVVYWSTTNGIQIGQQWFLLHRKGAPLSPSAKEADAEPPPTKEKNQEKPAQRGRPSLFGGSTGAAEQERRPPGGVVPRRGDDGRTGRSGGGTGGGTGGRAGSNGGRGNQRRRQRSGGGGGNAGSRKKRPKR
jgi:YidC/Oxa1 family membrane protein insertase